MIREDEVRRRLRARGEEVSDGLWEWLVDEGHVGEVAGGFSDLNYLIKKVRQFRSYFSKHSGSGRNRDLVERHAITARGDRQMALSLLRAEQAAGESETRAFRALVFSGRLLSWGEVEGWITKQRLADGEPTTWLTDLPLPPSHQLTGTIREVAIRPPLRLATSGEIPFRTTRRYLAYATPESQGVQRVPITAGGILDRLRRLSTQLSRDYDWQEAQATIFVLADAVPIIPAIRTTVSARITLSVDPTVSAREVADAYRLARKEAFGTHMRRQKDRLNQLAVWVALRPAKERREERMRAWNREFPDWQYEHRSNFVRDCTKARRQLLGDE